MVTTYDYKNWCDECYDESCEHLKDQCIEHCEICIKKSIII